MQTFTTDRQLYLTNEFKSWIDKITFLLLLYFIFKLFFSIPQDTLFVGCVAMFLLKLGDTLTQYHVKLITIEKENNQLTFLLYSLISGQKTKTYDLHQAHTELVTNSLWTKLLGSPLTLRILLPKNHTFRISSRYGYSTFTLTKIDTALKQINSQVVTQ